MGILGAIICLAFFFLVLFDFCQRLPAGDAPKFRRWIIGWAAKGLLVPAVLWILFNSGIVDWLPIFTPEVQFANLAGHGLEAIAEVITGALLVIGSYWAAVTSAWLLAELAQRTKTPREFSQCALIWSLLLGPFAVLLTHKFGWQCAGLGGTLWFLPILQRTLTLQPEEKYRPIYSQAIAKLHFDKHAEAETAVLQELEKCEEDFDGWLMLGELYASHFQDLPGAEDLIRQTCEHPATTSSQVAVAFHRLADWHLKANDPSAARRAVLEICRRYPTSHLDRMARLRLDQLPGSKEELLQRQSPKMISLPIHARPSDDSAVPQSRETALARVKFCVERLKKNPDDVGVREDLARIFAEQLGAVDAALDQLELLLAMPNQPEIKAAQWLALIAAWNAKYKNDEGAARKVLERLAERYPKTPQGFAAVGQLNQLKAEASLRALGSKPVPKI